MRFIITGLIFACLWCVANSVGGETEVYSPPWIRSAQDLRFEMKTEKSAYKAGEPVNLTFTIANVAGDAKVMQSGSPQVQFAIWVRRDGELIPTNKSNSVDEIKRSWSSLFSPTDPISAGKNHTERLELSGAYDLSVPGTYTVRAVKYYAISNRLKNRKDEKEGVDYLEATLKFTILPLK